MYISIKLIASIRTKSGDAEAEAAIEKTRAILRLNEHGTEYQTLYYAAIQDSPDIVIAHCQTEKLLTS